MGSSCFVLSAAEMIENGEPISNIINHLEEVKKSIKIFFTVDTLDYLQKGGRLSLAKATIGNMLNIKPILSVEEGIVKPVGQVRGKKQVLNKIINTIKENIGNDLSKKSNTYLWR
ncbi:DegV family protein [Paraclostridium bifermentans]|uniref:DegV family protein n=1 Tax=Paraclostridium bifermentans TaxID=1490 RepID=A0ABY8R6Y9_PARBF|nr:DegV family protein [Paraclostridium bifermentans]